MKHILMAFLAIAALCVGCISASGDFAEPQVISLDGDDWRILPPVKSAAMPVPDESLAAPGISLDGWQQIHVPHPCWHRLFPETYPDNCNPGGNYQFTGTPTYVSGWFDRVFHVPELDGGRAYLEFGAISFLGRIYVNGQFVGQHKGSFTGFEMDVTDFVKPGDNTLRVWVMNDFGENPPRHVYGKMFYAASNYGGITGGVSLKFTGPVNVKKILAIPHFDDGTVTFETQVRNETGRDEELCLAVTLVGSDGRSQRQEFLSEIYAPGISTHFVTMELDDPIAWSPDNPFLYDIDIEVLDMNGAMVARARDRFGYREFKAVGNKFYLNGKRIKLYCGNILTSDNWERFLPGLDEASRADLLRQKNAGVNAIRYHIGTMDSHLLLQITDELGLLVIDEFPMFHRVFSNLIFPTQEQRDEFMETTTHEWTERILRDHNHPSAVIWSLSNEVWTDSTTDELTELHAAMQGIDRQGRPLNSGSGLHSFGIPTIPVESDMYDSHLYNVPGAIPPPLASHDFDRYFRDLEQIYGKEAAHEKPAIVSESMLVGYVRPTEKVPLDSDVSVQEYLIYLDANRKGTLNWYGLRSFLAGMTPDGRDTTDAIIKDGFEQFRKYPGFQGLHLWTQRRNIIYPSHSMLMNSLFVGAEKLTAHAPADGTLAFSLLVVDDAMEGGEGLAKCRLLNADGETLAAKEVAVKLENGQERLEIPMAWELSSESLQPGFVELRLDLDFDGRNTTNFYDVCLMPSIDLGGLRFEDGVLGKCDFGSGALDFLAVSEVASQNLSSFKAVVVHVPEGCQGDFEAAGASWGEYVRKGGRLLLLNLPSGTKLDFLLPGYTVLSGRNLEESAAMMMEAVDTKHPVLAGLTTRHFQRFNGGEGILAQALLYPVGANVVAAAFPSGINGPGMAVADFGMESGEVLVVQADLLTRLDDPVAAQLLKNALECIVQNGRTPCPMQKGEANPALEKFSAIPEGECRPIDLDGVANRSFRDEPSGERGWTHTGIPDFRFGPSGSRKFAGISYRIAAQGEMGRAIILKGGHTQDCPERIEIPLSEAGSFSQFIVFHAAWYPSGAQEVMKYCFRHADGSELEWPIVNGQEIGDWFAPYDRECAVVAWRDVNPQLQAPFGFYASIWNNPAPDEPITSIAIQSAGQGTPIVFAITGVRYRDFATEILGRPWNHSTYDFANSYALKRTDSHDVFIMERDHAWIEPKLNKHFIKGNDWKILRFSLKASAPLRLKMRYNAPTGDNAVSGWIEPIASEDGMDFYEIDMTRLAWPQSSSPEARAWGGRDATILSFALDFYAPKGTEVTIGQIRLAPF